MKEIHFDKIVLPSEGEKIQVAEDKLVVPDCPIIPFIEGDGIGPDIMRAAQGVWNAAVAKAYGGSRKIVWLELFAGEKALQRYGELLPQDTFRAIEHFVVAIKGPLTTPVGTGYR
ncbi:MAG: NADP-dependent isocitrate dehydrogenase, partial [Candidatus Latescibacterota bacterium]